MEGENRGVEGKKREAEDHEKGEGENRGVEGEKREAEDDQEGEKRGV